MKYSINAAQLELLASNYLNTLGTTPSIMEGNLMDNVLVGVAQGLCDALIQSAREKDVVASKRLIQGIDPTPSREVPGGIEVSIVMPNHWKEANYGQRPGKRPKVSDIEKWISAKQIKVRQSRGHSLKTILAQRHAMAVSIANAIERKGTIKRFGYKGSRFIEQVLTPDNMRKISELVAKLAGKKIQVYMASPTL